MITGSHTIIYSMNSEADRRFLKDVLKLSNVDVGGGWLIFGLPPSEVAVHPSEQNDVHEFYLICENVHKFVQEMNHAGIQCDPVLEREWGLITQVHLPGGGKLGVYEARHARPNVQTAGAPSRKKTSAAAPKRKVAAPAKKIAGKPATAAKKKRR